MNMRWHTTVVEKLTEGGSSLKTGEDVAERHKRKILGMICTGQLVAVSFRVVGKEKNVNGLVHATLSTDCYDLSLPRSDHVRNCKGASSVLSL
jgi:hypothetical protein